MRKRNGTKTIKKFPQMNGPYAPSEKEFNEMENQSEALETVKKLAREHDVGFFDVSGEGEIIL
ncbi:MAG: hypothetical protein LBQ63_06475 [Deltaproteobacteria bacterium]|jgi:hypothetical protein|nr:hypothetical protein [Deltaproteobacteria bacterium]